LKLAARIQNEARLQATDLAALAAGRGARPVARVGYWQQRQATIDAQVADTQRLAAVKLMFVDGPKQVRGNRVTCATMGLGCAAARRRRRFRSSLEPVSQLRRMDKHPMKKSKVHLFVFDTMADWEYGYLIAGINNPQFQKTPGRFKVETVSLSDKPIATMGGLRVVPDLTLEKLRPENSSIWVLPGGTAWDLKKNMEAAQLAADFLAKGTPVAAICGATAGLARIGLLDEVPHTSNSKDYIAATGYKGIAFFRNQPAVKSGNLITASAMSSLEFAREVFSTLDVYSEAGLAAWYSLYKTGDAKYFAALMKPGDA
jgi:putative intracellular protease/amidase